MWERLRKINKEFKDIKEAKKKPKKCLKQFQNKNVNTFLL